MTDYNEIVRQLEKAYDALTTAYRMDEDNKVFKIGQWYELTRQINDMETKANKEADE